MFSRRILSVLRSRRDTCICEISSCRAISVCVSPSKKRRYRTLLLLRGELLECHRERGPVVDDGHQRVVLADVLEDRERVGSVSSAVGLERDEVVRLTRLHGLEDLLGGDAEVLGDLGDRRRVLESLRERVDRLVHLERELLKTTRDLDGPALVAEVALDLPHDRGRRVGGELDLAVDVEAVDSLDEADGPDLDQVVDRLTAVPEPAREVASRGSGTS